jgi:hypothetical protein
MLMGERAEPYLLPSRERRFVCELCAIRAQREGWIREAADPATPVQPPRPSDRRRRLFRRRRRRTAVRVGQGVAEAEGTGAEPVEEELEAASVEARGEPVFSLDTPRAPRDPRHVRAVPTNAQLKIERAIGLFNSSEHARTVVGIARTLGPPRVSASTSDSSAAEVVLTVAWELSWYQFAVDLSDTSDAVRMEGRGEELSDLPEAARDWNAHAKDDGTLAIGAPKSSNGDNPDQAV